MFDAWHQFRDGRLTRRQLERTLGPHIAALGDVLAHGRRSDDATLARFCDRLLDAYPRLWRFVSVPGVEPTNNAAERAQRRAVI